jgi:lipid-binding SYLF domain-containing protein
MFRSSIAVLAVAAALAPALFAATEADKRLDASADLVTDMMNASDKGIPQDLLNRSECVVLIPGLKKAAFVVGAKFGRGFSMCRRADGNGWTAPAAIRVEGGSLGFQIGASEQDVLLLIMNESGMKRLLADKFTVGAEMTAAAGPVGRNATAQTDAVMRAEMLSYSRSRGLFAGVSLDGATLRPDADANEELYGKAITNKEIITTDVKAPAAADKLENLMDRNSVRKTK